jgi:hypothetical protein
VGGGGVGVGGGGGDDEGGGGGVGGGGGGGGIAIGAVEGSSGNKMLPQPLVIGFVAPPKPEVNLPHDSHGENKRTITVKQVVK